MRIAIWHNLPTGGGLRVLDDQLRGLASLGHELHVWAPPTAARCDAVDAVATYHEITLDLPAPREGTFRQLAWAWRGRREDLDAFADHASRCAREISGIRPDVVLAHPCQFFRVPAIAQYIDIPSVLYLQEPNRRLYEASFDYPWKAASATRSLRPSSVRTFVDDAIRVEQARIQVRAETAWIDAFDDVLVNSAFSRESVLRAYGRLSRVSPLGIDTDRFPFQERPARSRGNVCTVGALVLEKNPVFLVRAVAAAGPAVQRFTWVANFVNRWHRDLAERAATEAGVSLDVRVSLSAEDLLSSYSEADVFVYAPRLEPFGLAPLEANATGLPVVAVAEGGVRETMVEGVNGTVVEHDAAAFGAAVAALIGDIDHARALGVSARQHVVERWPIKTSIETLEANLRFVLERRREPAAAEQSRDFRLLPGEDLPDSQGMAVGDIDEG